MSTSGSLVGGFTWNNDFDNLTGTLEATNPTCVLTVPNNPVAAGQGYGPNGGVLLDGSSECPGSYELFLSDAASKVGNDGVFSGTFAIVNLQDQKTVNWAGTYTEVTNGEGVVTPRPSSLSPLCTNPGTFCANLPPSFGTPSFNGTWLQALIMLNGFTWNVPGGDNK